MRKTIIVVAACVASFGISTLAARHQAVVKAGPATPPAQPSCTANGTPSGGPNWSVVISCIDASGNLVTQRFPVPTQPSATWVGDAAATLQSAQSTVDQNLQLFPADGQPITPTAAANPTSPNPVITQFQTDYAAMRQCQYAIAQGLISAADPTCSAQIAATIIEFSKNESLLLPVIGQ